LLFSITAAAAVAAGLVPIVSRPILEASLRAFDDFAVGAFYGSLVGVTLLVSLPVTLLGFVTPFAIRLTVTNVASAGNTAGRIYALSTVGSIVGSFLPVIVLIPLVGTARTFQLLALGLLLPSCLALFALRAPRLATLAIVGGLAMIAIGQATADDPIKPPDRGRLVYEEESEYNYIQVLQEDGRILLALNEGHAVHSIYDPDQILTGGPWDYFMVAPLFNPAEDASTTESALLIGLAGGTVARQLTAAYGPIPIDGVEIDPAILDVGREYFAIDGASLPNLNGVVADGRYFLRTTDKRYDLVGVDAYRQPYIPFQLTSREFFSEVADHLAPGGVAVVNVGRTATDYRLVDVIASTMNAVFPFVFAIDVDRYHNTIVVGTFNPNGLADFAANAAALDEGSPLRQVAERSLATGRIRLVPPGDVVFTDDHAPVELVVDQIILDVAREGDEE
jgi:spermidine synthase